MKSVEDISHMFSLCSSLKKLPDISKWDINSISKLQKFINEYSSSKYNYNINNFEIYFEKWINHNMITDINYIINIPF